MKSLDIQAQQPMSAFAAAAVSDRGAVFGHYRLIDQPNTWAVTPKKILAPHRKRMLKRMQGQKEVLCVQDGMDLNFANHGGGKGLGLVSSNQNLAGTLGIHMHSLLVLNAQGVPLGVPHIEYENLNDEGSKTQRWLRGLQVTAQLAKSLSEVRSVAVMGREADCFEVMAACRRLPQVELLVRARHGRSQGKGRPKMFAAIRAQPSQARLEVPVMAHSARRSSRSQKVRSKQPKRMATVELRWRRAEIQPTSGFADEKPVQMNLVHVYEPEAPAASTALEWLLLTSLAVTSVDEATAVVQRYLLRWRIEDWHRILKAGCKAEFLQFLKARRIERAVTINAVVAWRLAAMTLLGRETPELPMQVLFSDSEITVLKDFARDNRLKAPDNAGAGVLTMTRFAGYANRKNDLPSGYQNIWECYIQLANKSHAYEAAIYMMTRN